MFRIVIKLLRLTKAAIDIAKKIHELLSGAMNVTYNGQDYVVDEVTVTNGEGQNTSKHKLL